MANFSPSFHVALPETLGLEFLLTAGPLGDILPLAVPFLRNVISIGDVLLAAGIAWFLFSSIAHGRSDADTGVVSLWRARPEREVRDEEWEAALRHRLDRPSSWAAAWARDSARPRPQAARAAARSPRRPLPMPLPPRRSASAVAEHPYVATRTRCPVLAFWLAGTISLFGDRLHQIALGVMVFAFTGSALQTGLVFLAATLPNLLLGPIAGTFVDRWDQKRVMIVSDLLRPALVLAHPVRRRGRRLARLSARLRHHDGQPLLPAGQGRRSCRASCRASDLTPANGAIWTGETARRHRGLPARRPVRRPSSDRSWRSRSGSTRSRTSSAPSCWRASSSHRSRARLGPRVGGAVAGVPRRASGRLALPARQTALFQNTLVSVLAQLSIGTTLALMVVYAKESLDGAVIPYPESYAVIEAAIGVGNLVGGFVVGAIGARLRKGWLIIPGFVVMGVATVVLGLTSNELLAVGAGIVIGVFNLVYVIPSQTLFGERTPAGLMGRVVAIRSSIVMGALTGAMAVSSGLAESVDAGVVIAFSGVLTVLAGVLAASCRRSATSDDNAAAAAAIIASADVGADRQRLQPSPPERSTIATMNGESTAMTDPREPQESSARGTRSCPEPAAEDARLDRDGSR